MFSIIRSSGSIHTKLAGYLLFTTSQNVATKVYPIIGLIRSHQTSVGGGSPISMDKIEHSQEPSQKGDVMSHSLEDEYSTRSDEEGFGGAFTGNESLSSREQDKIVHANSPEYDTTRGGETKEKGEG